MLGCMDEMGIGWIALMGRLLGMLMPKVAIALDHSVLEI
jgi:hypothetical protein